MDKLTLFNRFILIFILYILNFNLCFANLFTLPLPFDEIKESSIDGKTYDSHWQFLQYNFSWPLDFHHEIKRPEVEKQLEILKRHPNYMSKISERSEKYLFYLSEVIYNRNLPAELALLPIIESAFDPYANSSAGAAGLWQIMPKTAENFGIKLDWWYDGRRDIIMSTNAALDYLEKLYKDFDNDWLLSLAAYNSGEGTVRKAIKQNIQVNKNIDFWSLDLPKETKQYVPKLLAFIEVINNPKKYNQNFNYLPHEPYFTVTELENQIDLNVAAELSHSSVQEIYNLNPGFNRFATAPDGPHRIILPIHNSIIFNYNLKNIKDPQLVQYKKYTTKKGDSLDKIAKKFNTPIQIIKNMNNLANNTIGINKDLIIPINNS